MDYDQEIEDRASGSESRPCRNCHQLFADHDNESRCPFENDFDIRYEPMTAEDAQSDQNSEVI